LAAVVIALLPLLLVIAVWFALWRLGLLFSVWIFWCAKGRNVLFVYSDSPNWKEYVETNILSRFDNTVVVLNWSNRSKWKTSLAKLVFQHWGGRREFNPLGVVFKPFHRTRVFRFHKAFMDSKHGKSENLKKLEAEFFAKLG
jgi:hypothetical protein